MGARFDSQVVLDFAKLYPAIKISQSSHNTVAFQLDDQVVPVEELVAMELINIRKNAELMADESIRDVILTVPSHYNQAARMALIASARLAGLRVIELISDGLAVAVDYAKARNFNTSQNHIIFDMGAGSTSATIVKLSSKSVKDVGRFNKTITTVNVLGVGSNLKVSGNIMTLRLYSHLLEEFERQYSGRVSASIAENPRAIARLHKEASRVKQVLSANNDAMVSIESLHEDIDFRYQVSRAQFEQLTADLAKVSVEPIRSALSMADLSIDTIDSLILHGGAARVPFVQQALLEIITEEKIARNVNADEAAVMGAVFRGAGLSGSFRVKEVIPQDICPHAYTYSDGSNERQLFSVGTPLGSTFNISIDNSVDEHTLIIQCSEPGEAPSAVPVASIKLSSIANATNSLEKEHKCKNPEILAVVRLDQSGIVSISEASAVCEVLEKQGVADKVKGWFGGKESTVDVKSEDKKTAESSAAESVNRTVLKRAPVAHSMEYLEIQALPNTAHEQSAARIRKFEQYDTDRIARETARNGLEAYIYKVRDLLDSDSFAEVSTDDERSDLKSLAADADEWMYGDGETAPLADLVAKRRTMSIVVDPIDLRKRELRTRDDKISALQKQISTARSFAKKQSEQIETYATKKVQLDERLMAEMESKLAKQTGNDANNENEAEDEEMNFQEFTFPGMEDLFEPLYTKSDIEALETNIDDVERWLSAKTEEQTSLQKYENPVLLSSDLESKATKLKDELVAIIGRASYKQQAKPKSKAKPKATKKKNGPKSSTKSTSAGSTDTPLSDEPVAPAPDESPAQDSSSVLEESYESAAPAAEPAATADVKDEL